MSAGKTTESVRDQCDWDQEGGTDSSLSSVDSEELQVPSPNGVEEAMHSDASDVDM